MKNITFEKWLEDWFMKLEPTVTKDNFEELFDRWVSEIETEDLIGYADIYAKDCYLNGKEEILNIMKKI